MGRPRELAAAVTKSFRLPKDLIDKLNKDAKLRGVDASDVVRELLNEGLDLRRPESERIWRERMQRTLATMQRDPALATIFAEQVASRNPVLPLNAGLGSDQIKLLIEAIEAAKALEQNKDQGRAKTTEEWLRELAGEDGVKTKARQHLIDLAAAAAEDQGRFAMCGDATEPLLEVTEELGAKLKGRRDFDDWVAEALRFLIKEKWFAKSEPHCHGTTDYDTYRWRNPRRG